MGALTGKLCVDCCITLYSILSIAFYHILDVSSIQVYHEFQPDAKHFRHQIDELDILNLNPEKV